jgi:hypothetical protein
MILHSWSVVSADGQKIEGVDLSQAPMMIVGADEGEQTWWFSAPDPFLGDLSALHGGNLSYR